MKMRAFGHGIVTVSVAALAALGAAAADACSASLASGGSYPTIGQAVAKAAVVDTITIDGSTGPCNENVLVDNTHLRMIITGIHNAVITGATSGGATTATLDLRVKGVGVSGLTVNGGTRGIVIQRNTNAVIQNVTVQNSSGEGIVVDSMGFAVILNSTIKNHPKSGIVVAGLASARIGVNLFEDQGASPSYAGNVIQGTQLGISVFGNGNAQIYANNISSNTYTGILVLGSSSISTGGNTINSNGASGIATLGNSSVLLGVSPDFSSADPDKTTALNGRYGIECGIGSSVVVKTAGTLNGSLGLFGQDGTCPGGLNTNVQLP
jgi:parallel beta-helix repeat protein